MNFFEEQFGDQPQAGLVAVKRQPVIRKQQPQKGISAADQEGQLTVDVYEDENDIVIKSTIAGVTSEDIDISITNDMVTIRGNRQPDEKVNASDYHYQELYWGPFSRSIILPEEIDSDNASASMKNGILTLRLPKLSSTKVKKVKIS